MDKRHLARLVNKSINGEIPSATSIETGERQVTKNVSNFSLASDNTEQMQDKLYGGVIPKAIKPNTSRNYAYMRVSTQEQTEARQMDALMALNIEIDERDIYIDHWTGTSFDRPYYQAMKRSIRPGDTLYIKSLDRFGRNKQEIKEEWKWFMDNDIDIVVLDTPLISTTNYKNMGNMGKFISDLILEILSWLAEEEIAMIKQRQKEGMDAARQRGVVFGRPRVEIDDKFVNTYKIWKAGRISAVDAMKRCEMSKATFYRRVAEYEEALGIRDKGLDEEILNLIMDYKRGKVSLEDIKKLGEEKRGED